MSNPKFTDFFVKLRSDASFRDRFVKDPAATLKAEGFDPSKLDLPAHIDGASLAGKLDRLFNNQETYRAPTPEEVSHATADELWNKFNFIRGSASDDPSVSAVVAYGVAMVTSNGSSVAVNVNSSGRGLAGRRFTARLPGDLAIEGLSMDDVVELYNRVRNTNK